MILRAEAVKEQKIREAAGEAAAIEMVQKALADSLVKLNQANPNEQVIQLKALEAFAKAADGRATKIIIPSEIQGLAGLTAGIKEIVTSDKQDPPAKAVYLPVNVRQNNQKKAANCRLFLALENDTMLLQHH